MKVARKTSKSGSLIKDTTTTRVKNSNVKIGLKKKLGKNAEKTNKKNLNSNSVKSSKKYHKEQMQIDGLKDIDPEFYTFLQENDKNLLDLNLFDSDDDMDSEHGEQHPKSLQTNGNTRADDESNDSENEDPALHTPNARLEVASDESDFEDDADAGVAVNDTQKITLNLLRQWQQQLEQINVPIDVVRKVIQAFNSALASIAGDAKESGATTEFKVVGSAAFNGVVQLCVLYLQPAIMRLLGLSPRSTTPFHKTKKWVKVRSCLRYYLTDLIKLIEHVSGSNLLAVLLKHLHQMAGMIASFSNLAKMILKRLIVLWSTSDETVRVLAFLCILKITRCQQVSMLHHVLKAMYLSYVRNSKFVSPNTLPGINFMRRSLVEMFALDLNVTYQHAFLYIRQLAIHLRNAVILQKKDSFQAVYNWQYVNSLRLWIDLLGATTIKQSQLQPLIYPIVIIVMGVIRLVPTAQYFPLRFHCIQMLISLSKETHVFIPILPYVVEVLRSNTFNQKHTSVSMRPLQFTCILRLNKAQLGENGFRDEVIEQICGLILEYLAHESGSLSFSDLIAPTVIIFKEYLKSCRNSNYSRKLKQLLDKIQENARYIDNERTKVVFGLKDATQIQAWETQIRNKGTPLQIYYINWMKTHEMKKRRQAAQIDNINSDYNLPAIKKPIRNKTVPVRNESGEIELFPSDESDNEISDVVFGDKTENNANVKLPKTTKAKKSASPKIKTKNKSSGTNDVRVHQEDIDDDEDNVNQIDIVKELDLNDW